LSDLHLGLHELKILSADTKRATAGALWHTPFSAREAIKTEQAY
jgi:hypothetical protein